MSYQIRKANQSDFPGLEKLLNGYYQGNWRGNIEQLKRDSEDDIFEILVTEGGDKELIGFLIWKLTYDLNWCLKGGEVIDFYVSPMHRGRGAALLLTIGMAKEARKRGAAFLKGGSENQVVHRTYGRIAMRQPDGELYVSGHAFRHLAELSGKNPREIVRNLPEAAWNYEP
jgi:GNAT superfamily N-acetyltransferase